MGYSSRRGRRPDEAASKSAHTFVINDSEVQAFLERCERPARANDVEVPESSYVTIEAPAHNPIRHVLAIDGGFTEVVVDSDFPSSTLAFFQFGALVFNIEDLEALDRQPFIDPGDIARLKRIQRLKLALPTRGVGIKGITSLTHSVRQSLYEFLVRDLDGNSLMDALAWLVFSQYKPRSEWSTWQLSSCPHCKLQNVVLDASGMGADYRMPCPRCGNDILLNDVLRLHEGIDDEIGAGRILSYVVTSIEQILLAFTIRLLLATRPALLSETLFIKDGPLAFFGFTANLHQPMRRLVSFLQEKHDLFLAGLEKSGSFVEHADEIAQRLQPGTALLLTNDYIYRYIVPGRADPLRPYGGNTYYGTKLIFKASTGELYVVTLPTPKPLPNPESRQIRNLAPVLDNIGKLRCDMYDSALLPVALVNKLVSLADHPSAAVLSAFAKKALHLS